MGLHLDLDEMDESKLRAELERRSQARELGLCDYCGRDGDTEPCKERARHHVAAQAYERQQRRKQGIREVGVNYAGPLGTW